MLTSSCLVSDSCLDESGDVCVNNRPALIGQSGVSYFITVLACVACLMFTHCPSLIQDWLLLHEGSLGIKSINSRTDRENGRIRSQLGLYNTV